MTRASATPCTPRTRLRISRANAKPCWREPPSTWISMGDEAPILRAVDTMPPVLKLRRRSANRRLA